MSPVFRMLKPWWGGRGWITCQDSCVLAPGLQQIYVLSLSLGVPRRAVSGEHCGFVIGLLWQKGKTREFFPSILFHSLGKKIKPKPNNKTGMPVISCGSGTALLIYFKVSFRTVCLISTLHGAALPKGGKAPLPGKLVLFFFSRIGCPLLHPT